MEETPLIEVRISMDEVYQIRELATNILETNAKVMNMLQEREADSNADKEQRDRVHDLEDSFKRLEKRMQEGEDEFQELENMVRDLLPRLERAAPQVGNHTRGLNIDQNQFILEDLGTTKLLQRSGGQNLNDGFSELLSHRENIDTNIRKFTTEQYDADNTPSETNLARSNIEYHTGKKEVRFADDSAIPHRKTSVDSRKSFLGMKSRSPGERAKGKPKNQTYDYSSSGETPHTAKVTVTETGFKRKLTDKKVDNRLHYFENFGINKKENQNKVEACKEKKSSEGIPQGEGHSDAKVKSGAVAEYMKDGMARKSETPMRSDGGHDNLKEPMSSSSKKEGLERVSKYPDVAQQIADKDEHVSTGLSLKEDMEVSAYMEEVTRKTEKERIKGVTFKLPRGNGPDTVLCLDTSGSMEGTAFQEMISIAIGIVAEIQRFSREAGIPENIGVATFGKQTGVSLHLTNQYDQVKKLLLSLKAEGPSPMFEGIHMALAACNIDRNVSINGIYIGSRIILISDGKGTPDHWNLLGDSVDNKNGKARLLVNNYMVAAGHLVRSHGHSIYSVPVGDYTEETLERVACISGGYIIPKDEICRVQNFSHLQIAAATHVYNCRNLGEGVDREPFLRSMITTPAGTQAAFCDHCQNDLLPLALKLAKRPIKGKDLSNKQSDVTGYTYMPCIGTRVRRGPNWHWGNQDCEGPGTIVGYQSEEWVRVEWDIGGNRHHYKYAPGVHEVTVVEEERHLAAGEDIAVGCKVKRGKDWTFGDQDGGEGTVGVVCRVKRDKTVDVRWPNKSMREYNYGAGGRFELDVINQRETSETSASILPPRRGERIIADHVNDALKEMSIEDMNRLNKNK